MKVIICGGGWGYAVPYGEGGWELSEGALGPGALLIRSSKTMLNKTNHSLILVTDLVIIFFFHKKI